MNERGIAVDVQLITEATPVAVLSAAVALPTFAACSAAVSADMTAAAAVLSTIMNETLVRVR